MGLRSFTHRSTHGGASLPALSLVALLAVPCAGTTAPAGDGASTTAIEVASVPSDPAPVARMRALDQRCRSAIPATTFQQAAEALSQVRAAIGRLCSIELVGDTPLQWRVSCGADDFFASGRHEFGSPTACEGGTNAFECLGHGLRSMASHLDSIDVAVVGHVDLEPPVNQRLDCRDLRDGWAESPWPRVVRNRDRANERLAWCRAARAADSVRTGLGGAGTIRVASVGLASQWLSTRMNPTAEGATCPAPTTEADVPADGRCQSARRVDLLVRLAAEPSAATTACTRQGDTPADVLYCLEECAARPNASQSGLSNPPAFLGGNATSVQPRPGIFVTRTAGSPAVELDAVLRRLQL